MSKRKYIQISIGDRFFRLKVIGERHHLVEFAGGMTIDRCERKVARPLREPRGIHVSRICIRRNCVERFVP